MSSCDEGSRDGSLAFWWREEFNGRVYKKIVSRYRDMDFGHVSRG
jgi:hypothetical protein